MTTLDTPATRPVPLTFLLPGRRQLLVQRAPLYDLRERWEPDGCDDGDLQDDGANAARDAGGSDADAGNGLAESG